VQRNSNRLVRWFSDVGIEDVPIVGGKNASLGEMYRELASKGVRVPNGFATTADAYRQLLHETGLERVISDLLAGLDTRDLDELQRRGLLVRQAILAATLPAELERAIVDAYDRLGEGVRSGVDVAVRSSATAEDLPDASFAGQQETYLNVQGHAALIDSCSGASRRCSPSRDLASRRQGSTTRRSRCDGSRMVRSDLGVAGVMFTIDTESGFRDAVLINASYGLGENVVQGSVNPDEYCVFKPPLSTGRSPILQKNLGTKEWKLVYDVGGSKLVKNVPVATAERARFALCEDDILALARWGCIIEDHYRTKTGHDSPMDIEWAKDGITGELFVVQARPETVESRKQRDVLETYRLGATGTRLVEGRSIGEKIAHGPVRVIQSAHHLQQFQSGEVLVTDKTDPDWEPIMKRAAAIVTNRGGRTCHAAIVSRELGLPAIVGTERGTELVKDGQLVTVSCAEGPRRRVRWEAPVRGRARQLAVS
jgi:pyruvate,water dikinase